MFPIKDMIGRDINIGDTFIIIHENVFYINREVRQLIGHSHVAADWVYHVEYCGDYSSRVSNSIKLLSHIAFFVPKDIAEMGMPAVRNYLRLGGIEVEEPVDAQG